jgi:site-specific DNA-adenine methylase
MFKNHFFLGYAGNKRQEFTKIYDEFKKLNNITTIYEPFCGTSAFSYFLAREEPKKYKYILNDINKHLINLYEIARNEEKFKLLVEELNNIIIDLNKEKYLKIIKEDTLTAWIIKNKIYTIRAGLFPLNYKPINFEYLYKVPIIQFLRNENITFTNEPITSIKEEYNNKNTCIFLDPPYLTECNDFYDGSNSNIYEYLSNNEIKKFKCKMLIVLSDNWIIRLLFKKYIKVIYEKKYEVSKKKINHLIITNF